MDKTEGEDMFKQGTKRKDLMDIHTTSPHALDLPLLRRFHHLKVNLAFLSHNTPYSF